MVREGTLDVTYILVFVEQGSVLFSHRNGVSRPLKEVKKLEREKLN